MLEWQLMTDKKTKIVATIGPVAANEPMLEKMVEAGVNILRINFSHGDFAEHEPKVIFGRRVGEKLGVAVPILQDLGGPKIRIGDFATDDGIKLEPGQIFTLTTDKSVVGDTNRVSINYAKLPEEVVVGGIIYLHDGKKKLEVVEITGSEVKCKVLVGGPIKGRRGVNLPGAHLSIHSLTDKDKADLEFGIKHHVEYVAFSFVRHASDVQELRDLCASRNFQPKIIAKIEDCDGVANFNEILELVDGIMIGRGDMGIEVGFENVPIIQKEMIKKCNAVGKFVITATHCLESMIKNPVPTRAEVSDIANAVLDGTDAVMLSEETTLGDYPLEAVQMMAKTIVATEKSTWYHKK